MTEYRQKRQDNLWLLWSPTD